MLGYDLVWTITANKKAVDDIAKYLFEKFREKYGVRNIIDGRRFELVPFENGVWFGNRVSIEDANSTSVFVKIAGRVLFLRTILYTIGESATALIFIPLVCRYVVPYITPDSYAYYIDRFYNFINFVIIAGNVGNNLLWNRGIVEANLPKELEDIGFFVAVLLVIWKVLRLILAFFRSRIHEMRAKQEMSLWLGQVQEGYNASDVAGSTYPTAAQR